MRQIVLCTLLSLIASTLVAAEKPKDLEDKKSLFLYGEGWNFWVREPDNWFGDGNLANRMQANIVFYRKTEPPSDNSVLISITVSHKSDENTANDLSYDMGLYRKKYRAVHFEEIEGISSRDSLYRCYPKLFYAKYRFYEYVTYINPGKDYNYICSVSMHKPKIPATNEELNIYRSIITSLWFTSITVIDQQNP